MTMQTLTTYSGAIAAAMVFTELLRLGKRHGRDFTYQPPLPSGRPERGGLSIDFLFMEPPDLALNIRSSGNTTRSDTMTKAQLASEGITLILLDEAMVMQDVKRVVGEALRYRDVSRR